MILTITRRNDSEQFVEFFRKYGCSVVMSVVANGTANKSLLSMLGLSASEKMGSVTFADPALRRRLMRKLSSEMKIDMPDRGVAVSVPFSSAATMVWSRASRSSKAGSFFFIVNSGRRRAVVHKGYAKGRR